MMTDDMIKTDVVIIGSGAAGMMAALTVTQAGLRCVVLEKGNNIAVSNGARSGGPALADTSLQRKAAETVPADMLYQHMYRFARGTVNAALLHRAISRGSKVEEILLENGVEMKLLPDTYGVGFCARHMFVKGGLKRWQPLADQLIRQGGEIHLNCAGVSLCREDGKITGVMAADLSDGGRQREYRSKAVIIATGGYLGSQEMIREHFGNVEVFALGSKLSDGTGIKMALAAGGQKDRNWGICANEFGGANHKLLTARKKFSTNLVYAICGGLLVDREGRRFMNEQYLSDEPLSIGGEITLRSGRFYAVLDEEMYKGLTEKALYDFYGAPDDWHVGRMTGSKPFRHEEDDLEEDIQNGWAGCEETLQKAGECFGLDCLEQTVIEYNRMCAERKDSLFGKAPYLMKPLLKAPYYIFEYEPSAWCTFGGVKTDEFCRLLSRDQNPIHGVYVAGVDNGSCYMTPYYDNEGAALGLALTTGVVAGEHVVEYCSGKGEMENDSKRDN